MQVPSEGDEELRRRHGLIRAAFFFLLVSDGLMSPAGRFKKKILLQIHFHFHDSLPIEAPKLFIGTRMNADKNVKPQGII